MSDSAAPLFSSAPVQLGLDAPSLELVARVAESLKRACLDGASHVLQTYGRENALRLDTRIKEALLYVGHVERLLAQLQPPCKASGKGAKRPGAGKEAHRHPRDDSDDERSASTETHALARYKFPDQPLLTLFEELEFIANCPADAKLLVRARKYQPVSSWYAALLTRVTRTFLHKGETGATTMDFICGQIDLALARLKAWEQSRDAATSQLP